MIVPNIKIYCGFFMICKSFFLTLFLLFSLNSNTYAQEYYAGIDYGSKKHELGVTIISGGGSAKNDNETIEFTIGSKINNKFSIEASFIDFGGVNIDVNNTQGAQFSLKNGLIFIASADMNKVSNAKYEVDAILIGSKYNIYTDSTILGVGNIYLSGGLSFWNSDFTASNYTVYGNGVAINDAVAFNKTSDSSITPYFGIGYDWTINNRINLHFDITRYDIDNEKDVNASLGLSILSF
mgnify:CR=1 FL=1